MIPQRPGITISDALAENRDLRNMYETDEKISRLVNMAMKLEGLPTNTSTHAAGVLITDEQGVDAHVPMWVNDKAVVAQYDKDLLEGLGLLKMDFLGLKTLGVLGEAKDFVEMNHGVKIDFDELYKLPTMEPLKLIREGKTMGIFQLEGAGMTSFMKELMPDNIEDIIAGISLYRPGPMAEIPKFLYNKRNPHKIIYPFPEVEGILKETYGILTYQEQCMRAVIDIAGYDKSDSDNFRKVVAKKQVKYLPLHRKWFVEGRKKTDVDENGKVIEYPHEIPGGMAKGYSREDLEHFFDLMQEFGKYAFNKSHAAAYAFLAYVTAWFSYYYPVEFMAALLNSVRGDRKKVAKYIKYCRRVLDIEIVEPNVNVSTDRFMPLKNGNIVYALSVKSTKESAIKDLVVERSKNGDYEDMTDFIERTRSFMDKKTFESFIIAGAFNTFGITKSKWIAGLEDIWDNALKKSKEAEKRAIKSNKPFDFRENFVSRISNVLPSISEYPNEIALRMEKEVLGLYLTNNPLYKYSYSSKTISNFEMSKIEYEVDEETGAIILTDDTIKNYQKVKFIGLINEVMELVTKKKDQMGILEIEDLSGSGKAIIWPQQYSNLKNKIEADKVYLISGYLKVSSDEEPAIIIENVSLADEVVSDRVIIETSNPLEAKKLLDYISSDSMLQGTTPVYIMNGDMRILLSKEYWVNTNNFGKGSDIDFKIKVW